MKRKFKLSIKSLKNIFEFVDAFETENQLDAATRYAIDLAIEELFTNMIKYNQKKSGEVEIHLGVEDNNLVISLTDFNVPPFDITKVKEYNGTQSVEERPIGKVGVHLIRKIMDKVDYRYQNNNSIITLIKHLEKSRV